MVLSLLSCTARHSGRYLCTAQPQGCLPAEQEQPEPLFQPDRFCAEIGPCHRPFCLHVSHLHHALWRAYYPFLPTAWSTRRPEPHDDWTSSGELLPGNRVDLCPAWKTDTALLGAHADPDSCDPLLHQLFNGALHFWHLGAAATDRPVWICTRDQHCKHSEYAGGICQSGVQSSFPLDKLGDHASGPGPGALSARTGLLLLQH